MQRRLIFLSIIFFAAINAAAQCTGAISSFPYHETFEATNGGWIPGGTASDWTWGTPSKPTINAAGEGAKCWIIGGLTGSSYNSGERSWLQSPCFDFTTLVHPRISFKIFWESELNFDGADLQYSTNGGTTWLDLGSAASNSNCLGVNWYNNAAVRFISSKPGWAGSINGTCANGGGSGGWLTASHDLGILAGLSNVSFRFEFGAGTVCNNFDGFAFDDLQIFESVPNTADFSYTCKSTPAHTIDFISQSVCSTSSSWTFGDPASGNNTSTSNTPTHTFSAAGTYTVTLTSTFASGPPSSIPKQLTILDVSANITHAVSCNGGTDAVLTATASGSSGTYNYVWNTNPIQTTPSIMTGAGNYTVTVTSGTSSCPATATLNVVQPSALTAMSMITPQKCAAMNGAIISNISGGTLPYNYLWSNAAVTPDINNLTAGNYSLMVTDNNNCILNTGTITVPHDNGGLTTNLPTAAVICPNETLTLNAGIFSSYVWQDNSTNPTYTVTTPGTYSVSVTDINGCMATGTTVVKQGCLEPFFPTAFTPNGDTKNEMFGPAGNNFSGISDYHLEVYNRYGQLVFLSVDPYRKWDGKVNGKISGNETFVWFASYYVDRVKEFKKGTVMLVE